MSKNSFIVYTDNEAYGKLPDEQLGKLFRAMICYSQGDDVELDESDAAYWVFMSIKSVMDSNAKKYAKRRERAAEAANKRWEKEQEEEDDEEEEEEDEDDANACERMPTHKENANACERMPTHKENANACERINKDANASQEMPTHANGCLTVTVTDTVTDTVTATDTVTDTVPVTEKRERARFRAPTIAEVGEFAKENEFKHIDPGRFVDYYAAQGWKLSNGNRMKDWKAAARNWERRERPKKAVNIHDFSAYTI